MLRYSLLIALLGTPALAQGLRPDDVLFSAGELEARLSGNTVEFFDGSKARYGSDGAYSYTYTDDDPPFLGAFTTTDGGEVCVAFDNGFSRCDTYVEANGRLVLIIADGTRFPARSVSPTPD